MKISMIKVALFTSILMISFIFILDNEFLAGVITLSSVMLGLLGMIILNNRKVMNLFEEQCDPVKFLDYLERVRKANRKNLKVNTMLDINQAAGLIMLGEFNQAKDILLSIDSSNIPNKKVNLLVYSINLMTCLYELGDISKAEKLYETQISKVKKENIKLYQMVEIVSAERLYFLNQLEESKERFQLLQLKKKSKRNQLEILYRLAQIDEKIGNIESAKIKYAKVAANGNQLWITKQAKQRIEALETN